MAGLTCAVLGLGPIGLLFCHVLKERGAARVFGVDRVDRSAIAPRFGVDDVVWGLHPALRRPRGGPGAA